MTAWTSEPLETVTKNSDLFVAPFREDGTTYGIPTQTRALVVNDQVYVCAANGPDSSWYRAAITQGAGRIRVDGDFIEVTFEAAGNTDEAAIDIAYEAKYPSSPAVPTMQGARPKAAAVRI